MFSLFRSLRHKAFALIWGGQTISILGDKVFQIALAWWVLQKTGSAVAMGTVLVLTTTPMLIFLLIGGVFVDRFSRIWLMLLSDLARGVVISLAAYLAFNDLLVVWHVYAFSLIFGFVDAFFQPAFRAVIPDVTPREDLPSANSLGSLSQRLAGIVGPALGAGIVSLGGFSLAFTMDGISFFISVVLLLPLLKRSKTVLAPSTVVADPVTPRERAPGILSDLGEGLKTVLASPWLWVTIGVAGLSNIAYAGPMEVALPFLLKDRWNADVSVLGLFYSLSSIGSVLAAVWMGRLPRLRRRGLILYGSWMMIGLLVIAVGLPIGIPGILAASFFIGACNTILGLVWVNTLQECVPNRLLGRVTSVDYLGSSLLLPAGYAFGGWATQILGYTTVFIAGGALQSILIALGLLHPQIRNLD